MWRLCYSDLYNSVHTAALSKRMPPPCPDKHTHTLTHTIFYIIWCASVHGLRLSPSAENQQGALSLSGHSGQGFSSALSPVQTKPVRIIEVGGDIWALSVLGLLLVRWPVQFSKYTIWVMVGIQGRVVVIDFSASAVHCSKLRPDGCSI